MARQTTLPITRARTARRILISIAAFFAISSRPAFAASAEEIELALQKGKAFLYSKQRHDIWEGKNTPPKDEDIKKNPGGMSEGQWGEQTALATFALLSAGDSPQSDKLTTAVKFLLANDFKGTYAAGAKAEIYPLLPLSDAVRTSARGDVAKLTVGRFHDGTAKGLYDLLLDSDRKTHFDHAVSLFGVLGVAACERVPNIEVSTVSYWKPIEEAWIRDQDSSGAWALEQKATSKYPLSASMTAAGLAVLFITQDRLHADNGVGCRGNITSPPIENGLQWLGDNFESAVLSDRTQRYSPYSTLYDVERVGMASGRKYLGSTNWYEYGVDYLLKHQEPDGSWSKGQVPATCYALLFLAHGRAPVVFNKLQYDVAGAEGNWNQRPRDVANVVDNLSRQTERDLNWQTVNLKAPLNELHEAPILYLGGNQSLQFSADEEAKLKQFCEEGGIIYGNADCGSPDFATSFRKLGSKLFPSYEFRELPADHPIYTNEQYMRSSWKKPPHALGLSNGVRELMVIDPEADVAKSWQLEDTSAHLEAFQFAGNLFLYAVDKQNLLERGRTYLIEADKNVTTNQRIKLARLEYDGNWNPEPAGWRRMSAILHNNGAKLETYPMKLGAGKLGDGHGVGVKIAHLTGTTRFKLTPDQRTELKAFAEGNGTLIIDAAGGSGEFADYVESEFATIFGPAAADQLKQPLPPEDPIYNVPGGKIEEFAFRPFTRKIVEALHGPQVKVITVNNRPAIYYSREDLSAGLVGEPVDGVVGYSAETATAIMRNLLLVIGVGDKATVTAPLPGPTTAPSADATSASSPDQSSSPTTKPAKKSKSSTPKKKPTTKPKT